MSNKPLSISESAAVQMPMKTVASLIVIVALGTMGYFQIVERINIADTKIKIMEQDVEQNTEFRINNPITASIIARRFWAVHDAGGFVQDHGSFK